MNQADPPVDTDVGVGEAIVQVVEDGRAYASAQLALYKALATARLRAARVGLALALAAVTLAGSALVGLVVGLIVTLAPRVGAGAATAIVVGAVVLVAALLGWIAASRLGRAFGDVG